MKQNIITPLLIIVLSLLACSQSPEDARKELGQMNIPYSEHSFIESAANGDTMAVKLFLVAGMNVNSENGQALDYAVQKGRIEIVKVLLNAGADTNQGTPLITALRQNQVEILKILLDRRADVNIENGMALRIAANSGRINLVKLLLEKGADVTLGTAEGETALMNAVRQGHIEIVKLLLDKGANGADGGVLWVAIQNSRTELVKLLLDKGADANVKTQFNKTALMEAISQEQPEIIKLLLDKSADANVKDRNGETALIKALEIDQKTKNRATITKVLLRYAVGIDVNVNNFYGTPALFLAERSGDIELVRLLLDKGADADVKDHNETVLMVAIRHNEHPEIIKLLLDKNIEVNASTTGVPLVIHPATIDKADAVAVVNGQYIAKSALTDLEKEVATRGQGQSFPKEKLIEELVQRLLLIQDAMQKKLDQSPEVLRQFEAAKNTLLTQVALENYLKTNPVTDAELKAGYDSKVDSKQLKSLLDRKKVQKLVEDMRKRATVILLIDRDDVVAVVNGQNIAKSALTDLEKEVATRSQGQSFPKEKLIEELVQRQLLIQDALQKKLDQSPEVLTQLENIKNTLLTQAALQNYLKTNPVTDAELKAEFVSQLGVANATEYKASHILVKDEDEAKKLIAELDKGGKFADLANKHSLDAKESQNGGDLGWFAAGQMVEPFSEAVAKLEKGKYSKEPVKTQFGYHIILREDSRAQTPPSFDVIKEQLKPVLERKKVQKMVEEMRKQAKVEILVSLADEKSPAESTTTTAVTSTSSPEKTQVETIQAPPTNSTTQISSPNSDMQRSDNISQTQKETALKNIEQHVQKMLEAAMVNDENIIQENKQYLENQPKPPKGDRNAARKINEEALKLIQSQQYDQAVPLFAKAAQTDHSDVEILNNYGFVLMKSRDLDRALLVLTKALTMKPDRASAWANLADVLALQGHVDSATAGYMNVYRFSKNREKTYKILQNPQLHEDSPYVREALANAVQKITL